MFGSGASGNSSAVPEMMVAQPQRATLLNNFTTVHHVSSDIKIETAISNVASFAIT